MSATKTYLIRFISALSLTAVVLYAQAASEIPPPILQDVQIDANVSFNSTTNFYEYNYVVTNPESNTGKIHSIRIDISGRIDIRQFDTEGVTIQYGGGRTRTFGELLRMRINPVNMIPVGITVPDNWWGSIGASGYSAFNGNRLGGNDTAGILPGEVLDGFGLTSRGVPIIRKVTIVPSWIYVSGTIGGITKEEEGEARQLYKASRFTTHTLGPSQLVFFDIGNFGHWNQLGKDIPRADSLGWILDSDLSSTLQTQLASAREALDAGDGTLAKTRLQLMFDTLNASSPSQIRADAHNLIALNVSALIQGTRDTPIPFEPAYNLTPETATLTIGNTHTVTAKVVNSADKDAPVDDFFVIIEIVDGPHAGKGWTGYTDAKGEFTFSYVGTQVGTDNIVWMEESGGSNQRQRINQPIKVAFAGNLIGLLAGIRTVPDALAQVAVTWTGGPDLVVPFFMPPTVTLEGGNTVYITEVTQNIGILNSPESTTRYFLFDTFPFDPNTARVVSERRVPSIAPDEMSEPGTKTYTLPNDLPLGDYFLAACADADKEMVELNEANNCSFSQLKNSASVILRGIEITNNPPDCSQALPSVASLWPPNHRLHDVTINGITDPDDDPLTILVSHIKQDEPVNGLGDSDTSPDGFGVGTSTAKVRAERSGLGNGRVYEIGFTADDGQGGTCEGVVSVGVPHDKGKGSTPINDGANYDSTQP